MQPTPDLELFNYLNQTIASPALDFFFAIVASQKLWMPLLIIGGVALVIWGGFRGRIFLIMAAFSLAIGDGFVNKEIRRIVEKPRPHEVVVDARKVGLKQEYPPIVRVRITKEPKDDPGGSSFPSGHVINNTSVAAIAIALWPRATIPLIIWLCLVGFSRVYTGAHYPLDVVGTIPLALLVAFCSWKITGGLVYLASKKWPSLWGHWKNLRPKKSPQPAASAEN